MDAYDPTTNEVYIPNPSNNTILAISDETNSVVSSIPVGHIPISVAYDPTKGVLFVGNSEDSTTTIVSDRTKSVVDTVPISSVVMLYDSGKGVMLDLGNASIQFVSDDSLPSVSPTSTVPELSWLAILPLLISSFSLAVVTKLRHRKIAKL